MKFPAAQAAQSYNLTKVALKGNPAAATGPQAAETNNPAAFEAAHELVKTVAQGEEAARQMMTSNADPHSVVEAMAAAELAVETAVTVRDKVVEAYQELIRMPV